MASFIPTRWNLGEDQLGRLTAEAKQFKGESLWRDAWRRLRRSRPSYLALVFMALVGLLAILAPLLPVPSPVALSLRSSAGAPQWFWSEPAAVDSSQNPAPGTSPTRQRANWVNDGWRHRSILHLRAPIAVNAVAAQDTSALASLLDRIEQLTDRRPATELREDDDTPGIADVYVAVPLWQNDRPRQDHVDLGARIEASLEEQPLGSIEYVGTQFADGYWPLGTLDRAMVRGRAQLFGLWQTGNWLGTDSQGRDLLSRILWGSRTSILVGLAAALVSLLIGVTYGALSGYVGGRLDNLMMRIVDVLYSLPFIFVVIFLITIVNEYRTTLEDRWGIDREVIFFLVIGAIYWLTMARVVRGQVLQLRNTEFIEAARVMGASTTRVLFSHLIPNVLSIVIVYLTLTIPAVILFEAFLSFLGLGIEPPKVSWGLLAKDGTEAIHPLRIDWWLVVFPSIAMGTTLLALNVLGDGLRDALDPKMRGKS